MSTDLVDASLFNDNGSALSYALASCAVKNPMILMVTLLDLKAGW